MLNKHKKVSTIFMILFACFMMFSATITANAAVAFDDVKQGEYYYEPVQWAVEKNITTGLSALKFAPDATCNRGQIVTFLWRAAGKPETENSVCTFKDVDAKQFYYEPILWAVDEGITSGYNAEKFGPDDVCTRGQIVTFLWRYMGQIAPASDKHSFEDLGYGEYYYEPVLWAVENGITTGLNQTQFGPDAHCTRGQVVTFLYRALGDNPLKEDPLLNKLIENGLLPLNADGEDFITNEQFIALLIEGFGYELSGSDLGNSYDISGKYYPYYITAIENGILGSDVLAEHGEYAAGTEVIVWTGNAIGIQVGLDDLYKDVPEGNLSITQAVELVKAAAAWKQENLTVRSDAKNELQLQDNVQFTQADADTNVPVKIDTVNKKVTLENPDAVVLGLEEGEILYLAPGEAFPEGFLAKVTEIEEQDGAVVLTCEEPELFEVIKEADISTVITIGGKEQSPLLRSAPTLEFDDGSSYFDTDSNWSLDGLTWSVYTGAEEGATVHYETDNCKEKKGVYASLDFGLDVVVDVTIEATNTDVQEFSVYAAAISKVTGVAGYGTGGESDVTIELPDCTVPVSGPISLHLQPYLNIEASGELTIEVIPTITNTASFMYSDSIAPMYGNTPEVTTEFKAEAEGKLETGLGVELGLQLCGTPFFDGLELIELDVEVGLGVEGEIAVDQKVSTDGSDITHEGNHNTPDENGVIHTCYLCIDGPSYAYADMAIGLGEEIRDLFKEYLDLDPVYELREQETLFFWYYCAGEDYGPEFAFGICPHKKYEVEILVKDKNSGKPLAGVTIQIFDEKKITDQNGKVLVYLEDGTYAVNASADFCRPQMVSKNIRVKDEKIQVVLEMKEDTTVLNNGGNVVGFRGNTYYWKFSPDSYSTEAVFGNFTPSTTVKNQLICRDAAGNEKVLATDVSYGPIYICNDEIYYQKDSLLWAKMNLNGSDCTDLSNMTVLDVDNETESIIYESRQNYCLYVLKEDGKTCKIAENTFLYLGCYKSAVYYSMVKSTTTSKYTNNEYIEVYRYNLNTDTVKQLGTIFAGEYDTYSGVGLMDVYFSDDGIYVSYGSIAGTGLFFQSGGIAKVNYNGTGVQILLSQDASHPLGFEKIYLEDTSAGKKLYYYAGDGETIISIWDDAWFAKDVRCIDLSTESNTASSFVLSNIGDVVYENGRIQMLLDNSGKYTEILSASTIKAMGYDFLGEDVNGTYILVQDMNIVGEYAYFTVLKMHPDDSASISWRQGYAKDYMRFYQIRIGSGDAKLIYEY